MLVQTKAPVSRRDRTFFPDSLAFMVVGLSDILVFSIFVGTGLYYRRRPEVHKPLMLLATVGDSCGWADTRLACFCCLAHSLN